MNICRNTGGCHGGIAVPYRAADVALPGGDIVVTAVDQNLTYIIAATDVSAPAVISGRETDIDICRVFIIDLTVQAATHAAVCYRVVDIAAGNHFQSGVVCLQRRLVSEGTERHRDFTVNYRRICPVDARYASQRGSQSAFACRGTPVDL